MLARLRHDRALCLAVVVLLSGAPRLAGALAPAPAHRCECAAHGPEHRCTCRICSAAARAAHDRRIAKLPPCHRAAARQAAANEDREPPGPCLGPTCGRGDPRALVMPGQEIFALADAPPRVHADVPELLPAASGDPRERAAPPELPPPRS